jgi:phosphate acetyltransferase
MFPSMSEPPFSKSTRSSGAPPRARPAAHSLYLASTAPLSGKSLITLGLMDFMVSRSERVGFFRPIVPAKPEDDPDMILVSKRYGLPIGERVIAALSHDEARRIATESGTEEVYKRILEAYESLAARADFILCSGTDYSDVSYAFEFQFNLELARHLSCPVIAVINALSARADQVIGNVRLALEGFRAHNCSVAGIIVNRANPDAVHDIQRLATEQLSEDTPLFVLPEEPLLVRPTVRDVEAALGAERLDGTDESLSKEVLDVKVAAMELPSFLEHLTRGCLVIVSGDRADIIVGTVLANQSRAYPGLAGIVLTGGLRPTESVQRLVADQADARLPILAVDCDTYTAASRVKDVHSWVTADSARKLALASGLFQTAVDADRLFDRIGAVETRAVTPLMFEHRLIKRAAADKRRIVLPEGEEDRILRAADILLRRRVADLVLLGDEESIHRRASALGVDIGAAEIINPVHSPLRHAYSETYFAIRQHKGITRDQAFDIMGDCSYFGTMMVHRGEADGMVSGAIHTTSHTIRPAFEFIKTKPGVTLVSSVFFMCLEDRVLVYGDCAVNPNPSASELAEIALSAAQTASMFNIEPRVAMLSYSTGVSGQGKDVDRIREATRLAQSKRPDLLIEGPIQYDAAADMDVARTKMPESQVAGRATVFIFPDLNAGNNAYKAVQRSAHAVAVGPVLQGLNKPVNDLSRGCTVTDIVNTVAITAIQAQSK